MTEAIVLAVAILVAAVLMFGLSVGVGLVFAKRIDRVLQARLAATDAKTATAAAAGAATETTGHGVPPSPGDEATTDSQRKEMGDG
jgi:hypothetical protein